VNQKIFGAILSFITKFLSSKGKTEEISVEIPIDAPKPVVEPEKAPEPKVETKVAPKFTLIHKRFCADGIFGELQKDGQFFCYTLEHSYDNKPKLADGNYTCKRGPHRLHGMTADFETFEIMGIPHFNGVAVTGVLFHWGNYNKDSEGCVLLGSSETPTMVGNSRNEWAAFMHELIGFDSFELEVISENT
jgi:Family of unknown function (DUF5675)